MESTIWKRFGDRVLTKQNKINLCCCSNEPQEAWELTPCDLLLNQRTACFEVDSCLFPNRKYIEYNSFATGQTKTVCECQRLIANSYDLVYTSSQANAVSVAYTGPGVGQVIWGTSNVTLTDPTYGTRIVSFSTLTLDELITSLNASSTGRWVFTNTLSLAAACRPECIEPQTLNYVATATQSLSTVATPGITLVFETLETADIPFSLTPATFAASIATELNSLGLGSIFQTAETLGFPYNNANADGVRAFDIVIGGDRCGTAQTHIIYGKQRIAYQGSVDWRMQYPEGICAYYSAGNTDKYYQYNSITPCLYTYLDADGPYIHVSGLHCCPQKGVTINEPQNQDASITGYLQWANLNGIVNFGGSCYGVRVPWFVFGEEGRLKVDPSNLAHTTYLHSNIDYSDGTISGMAQIPCNCTPELFIGLFHKDVQWGPFGSYYPFIEVEEHPAWTDYVATSYFVSAGLPTRYGWDYRPKAQIRTRGTWTETTGIELKFHVSKTTPFYVGVPSGNDQISATIALDSLGAAWTLQSASVTGSYNILTYAVGNKTVGEFVNDVNAIRLDTTGVSCEVFSFCLPTFDVSGYPLKRVVNNSSELFDLGLFDANAAGTEWQTIYNPLVDRDLKSGANIMMGTKGYWNMFNTLSKTEGCFTTDPTGISQMSITDKPFTYHVNPNTYILGYGALDSDIYAILPPVCRLNRHLPKKSSALDEIPKDTPWFTAFQGCNTNVINLTYSTGLINIGDISDVRYGVTSGLVSLYGIRNAGVNILSTVDTNKNGSGYTVSGLIVDINALRWTTPGGALYQPFVATGLLPYDVYLDDSSWEDGSGKPVNYNLGTKTTTNYGFREPLNNTSSTGLSFNDVGASVNFQSWVRRRCEYLAPDGSSANNLFRLKHCIPPGAISLGSGAIAIDLDGDQAIEDNWVSAYGCTSYVCKTQWYIKADRCSCSDVYRCPIVRGTLGQTFPHPYNFDGDHFDNVSYWSVPGAGAPCNNIAVNQPDFYMCEYDLHPNCNIPMLVKVPYQVIAVDYQSSCTGIYFAYYNDQPDDFGCLPAWQFCYDDTYLDAAGWCQYIDPTNLTKVQKRNIPRTWPTTAYIAERTTVGFCSNQLFNQSNANYCAGLPASPCGWDRICNIITNVPSGYVDTATGFACNIPVLDSRSELCVLFRPYISDLTSDDVCGDANCSRIDITCGTKCCECYFECTTDGCATRLVKAPCSWTVDYSYDELGTAPLPCAFKGVDAAGGCNGGCCRHPGIVYLVNTLLGAVGEYHIDANFTQHNHTCGCLGIDGEQVYSRSIISSNCSPDPYYNPCDSPSLLPGEVACNNPGADPWCNGPVTTTTECPPQDDLYWYDKWHFSPSCVDSDSSDTHSNECGCSGPGDSWECETGSSDTHVDITGTGSFDLCSVGTRTCVRSTTTNAAGTSAFVGCAPGIFDRQLADNVGTEGVFTVNITETKTMSERTCAACPSEPVTVITYATVESWSNNFSNWVCGQANIAVRT